MPRPSMGELRAITERWETLANDEQASMAATRYAWVRSHTSDAVLLDVAAGTGYGLAQVPARLVIAADFVLASLQEAQRHQLRASLVQADAARIPLSAGSVDVVACLEALYYFPDVDAFLVEALRVLRPGGRLLISLPNRHRPQFNPSPGSSHYLDATELMSRAQHAGFIPRVRGAYRWDGPEGSRLLGLVRRVVIRLHLVPRSMRAKAVLKRLAYRNMQALSSAVWTASIEPMVDVEGDGSPYTMLYLEAAKP